MSPLLFVRTIFGPFQTYMPSLTNFSSAWGGTSAPWNLHARLRNAGVPAMTCWTTDGDKVESIATWQFFSENPTNDLGGEIKKLRNPNLFCNSRVA